MTLSQTHGPPCGLPCVEERPFKALGIEVTLHYCQKHWDRIKDKWEARGS